MDLVRVFPLSDWAKNLTMRIFYRACRNAALAFWHFQLLTHHYIARHTLKYFHWFQLQIGTWISKKCFDTSLHTSYFPEWILLKSIYSFSEKSLEFPLSKATFCFLTNVLHSLQNAKWNILSPFLKILLPGNCKTKKHIFQADFL